MLKATWCDEEEAEDAPRDIEEGLLVLAVDIGRYELFRFKALA